jgi:hypothetical protein
MVQPPNKKATPQTAADEIKSQMAQFCQGEQPEYLRWAKTSKGELRELDPKTTGIKAALRLAECGTFPRGKMTLYYRGGERQELGAHQCGHRACPRCGKRRGRRLGASMALALDRIREWGWRSDRVRFATLTIPNTTSAADGLQALSEAWHRVLANRRFSSLIAGGFRCFEVKAGNDGKWNVHLHAILYLWAPGIPYQTIREVWDKAARNDSGTSYNQRFDELRKKAKPRPGETKESAAARYLTKYLAKWEDMEGARQAPGGLPHLLAALEGRRMFSAWGLGSAARKIARLEKPEWMERYELSATGYQQGGEAPIAAEVDSPWLGVFTVPVPRPFIHPALSREDIPEQIEITGQRVMRVTSGNPLHRNAKQIELMPRTKKSLNDWLGYQDHARRTKERLELDAAGNRAAFRSAWRLWRQANPAPRMPRPFQWRPFVTGAKKEWTGRAETILGQRTRGSLGALLWQKVKPTEPGLNIPIHDRRSWAFQMANSCQHAIATARQQLNNKSTLEERAEYLQSLPGHIAAHWRVETWDADRWQ